MPQMLDLIRASAVPATLLQSAAKGALAVPPDEMIEIMVYLATQTQLFAEQARLTLAGWDEAASRAAAINPKSAKEVLGYMSSPQNLRPVLLPALLENPGIAEKIWTDFAASASRESVEIMLASPRVNQSRAILKTLANNPGLSGIQAENIANLLAAAPVAVTDQEGLADAGPEADKETEETLQAYLTEHATEISAEAEKPFQPIGGNYDELLGKSDEPAPEPEPEQAATPVVAAEKKPVAAKKAMPVADEKRGSTLQKISRLDIKGRIQLAMKGTKEERSLLIRDGTKLVALAVLDSPKISDGEVEKIAGQKNVLEAVLRAIPMKRRFAKLYPVTRNLVANPRTPLDVSLGLMKYILVADLRSMSGNKEISETVRKLATKMFKQKTDPTKKNT